MSYHVNFWKSELIDFVILQQDAFDAIDALCPLQRQRFMLDLVLEICDKDYEFEDYEKCRDFFKTLINELRQMNYSPYESEQFWGYNESVKKMTA